MAEGMNNDEKWKSIWQNTLNKCFNDGELILMLFSGYHLKM